MSVILDHLSYSYTSAVPVLEDVSCAIGPGWTGVVGANGEGKTTLLRLIAGDLRPDEGSVGLPSGLPPVWCPQTVDDSTVAIERFAVASDSTARRLHGLLALDPATLERWGTLSPGERKRWQVGAALAVQPDVLLLDEPTNHLDADGRALLVDALESFRGVGLVVSHDRTLLDGLCTRTLRVAGGDATLWNGGYETARQAWIDAGETAQRKRNALRAEQRKLDRRLADQRRAAEAKSARERRRLREALPGDSDARSMERKGRHAAGEAAGSRARAVVRAKSERIDAAVSELEVERQIGRTVSFGYEPARKRTLLAYEGPLRAGAITLAPHLSVVIGREDRILLRGPNGAGKSTLLDVLVAESSLPSDRLVHLPQELGEAGARTVLDRVRAMDGPARGRVLSLVAALGVDPDRLLASDQPSPGEGRKLLLAQGLGTHAWCLLLDEPTNHLDLPSIERLTAALTAFPGAFVVVTHDDAFGRDVATETWTIGDGAFRTG